MGSGGLVVDKILKGHRGACCMLHVYVGAGWHKTQ